MLDLNEYKIEYLICTDMGPRGFPWMMDGEDEDRNGSGDGNEDDD